MEMHERVARLEEHQIEQDRRIENNEKLTDAINKLGTNIEVLGTNINNKIEVMDSKISEVKQKVEDVDTKFDGLKAEVDELENRPAQTSQKILIWLVGLIGTAVVTGIIGLIATAI